MKIVLGDANEHVVGRQKKGGCASNRPAGPAGRLKRSPKGSRIYYQHFREVKHRDKRAREMGERIKK